jgi:hypothetical protein
MKTTNMLLLAAGAYLLYTWSAPQQPGTSLQMCRYPDGTTIAVPMGSACPRDPLHGGQSIPCGYPSSNVPC